MTPRLRAALLLAIGWFPVGTWANGSDGSFAVAVHYLHQGEPEKALGAFNRVDDSAAVHMGKAVALIDLGRGEEAIAELDRALELDPGRAAHIHLMSASAHEIMSNAEKAQAELTKGRALVDHDSLRALYDGFKAWGRPEDDAGSGYTVTLGMGWTDNATRRPSSIQFSDGVGDEDAVTLSLSGNAWHQLSGGDTWGLNVNVSGSQSTYMNESDYDYSWMGVGLASYWDAIPETLRLRADLDRDITFFGYDTLGQSTGLRLASVFAATEDSHFALAYAVRFQRYAFGDGSDEDRDGVRQSVTFSYNLLLDIAGHRLEIQPTLAFGDEDTEGGSLENEYWTYGAFVRASVVSSIYIYGDVSVMDRAYDHPNVRNGFTAPRDDTIQSVSLGVQWVQNANTSYTLAWTQLDQDSNIGVFDYTQNRVALYVTLNGK